MNNESEEMGEVRNVMDNMKILLFVVVVAIFTSYMTTKIITIHYFKVIDGYGQCCRRGNKKQMSAQEGLIQLIYVLVR